MDTDTAEATPMPREEAERVLNSLEILHGIALGGDWERWYFLDEEGRVVIETSDLWAIMWLDFGPRGTAETITERSPFALRRWAEQDKFYLTGQDDRREDATDRYFVDYATASRKDAERIREAVRRGEGRTRTREEMLTDPEYPRCAEALRDWELGDDSVVISVGRSFVQKHPQNFKEARAKLRWGLVDLPSA